MKLVAFSPISEDTSSEGILDLRKPLTGYFNASSIISAYCHSILNTDLQQITEPAPPWWSTVNTNLDKVKGHAQIWVDEIGPDLISIPQSIINFNNEFQGQLDTIKEIVTDIGKNKPTKEQRAELITIMTRLQSDLGKKGLGGEIKKLRKKVKNFGNDMSPDLKLLDQNSQTITKAIKEDKDTILDLQTDIGNLRAKIAANNAIATISEIGDGVFLVTGLVGGWIAAAFNPVAGIIVLIVGVIGLAASIAGTIAANVEIGQEQKAILDKTSQISQENKQILAMTSMAQHFTLLEAENKLAAIAIDDVHNAWKTLQSKLDAVVENLQNDQNDIGSFFEKGDLKTTESSWNQLAAWAEKMEASVSNSSFDSTLEPIKGAQKAA